MVCTKLVKCMYHVSRYKANNTKNLVLFAGGSGITPMLQIILKIVGDPDDKTQVTLINSHKTQDDLILNSVLGLLSQSEQVTVCILALFFVYSLLSFF